MNLASLTPGWRHLLQLIDRTQAEALIGRGIAAPSGKVRWGSRAANGAVSGILSLLLLTSCGARSNSVDDEFVSLRKKMVETQILARDITDQRVLAAMLEIPRHKFVPREFQAQSYEDYPVPIGDEQTISQPYIVAFMSEALKVKPEDRVLEIGTGSGYQSAVLSRLAKQVFSMEIVESLGKHAAETLAGLGYSNVEVRIGNGYKGWPEKAPFNAIIVTAAPDHIPQALLDQLAPGGRLIVPVGKAWQSLVRVTRGADGKLTREQLLPVRFVPMTGDTESGSSGSATPFSTQSPPTKSPDENDAKARKPTAEPTSH